MSDINTVRILSLDGGGVRGYLSLKFLQRFIQQWGIRSNELWKYFDVIAGTSIGGIQALGYAFGKSPEELESFFLEKAKRVFTIRSVPTGCGATKNSNRPNNLQKAALIVQDDPFYKSPCKPFDGTARGGGEDYGHNILQKVLVDNFGTNKMNNLKTKVVIPAYDVGQEKYVMFSNYEDMKFQGNEAKIVDVARATSAAPVYLPSHKFNDDQGVEREYVDGGIYQNNPAEIALSVGKALKPTASRYCIFSLGTGLGDKGFDGPKQAKTKNALDNLSQANLTTDGIERIFKLFDIACTGGQESVDFNLKIRASNTLEQLYYYRFQPKLAKEQNTELDNSDVSFLNYLAETANQQYDNDTDNINNFLGHLTA